jgi:hypothetical protein
MKALLVSLVAAGSLAMATQASAIDDAGAKALLQ